MSNKKIFIGVIGAGACTDEVSRLAGEVGERIAKAGAVLVCGGMGGVMEAACKGAEKQNGITVGILPGTDRNQGNAFVDYPILTGLGEGRNLLVVRNSDAIIALPGEFGTLSEIAFSLRLGKPVVGLSTWQVSDKIIQAKNAAEAVSIALDRARASRSEL
jgi:uncharacterized protein (TIGR00725 family)